MCIYIYTCVYICIYIYTYIYRFTPTYIHMCCRLSIRQTTSTCKPDLKPRPCDERSASYF